MAAQTCEMVGISGGFGVSAGVGFALWPMFARMSGGSQTQLMEEIFVSSQDMRKTTRCGVWGIAALLLVVALQTDCVVAQDAASKPPVDKQAEKEAFWPKSKRPE